MLVQDVIQSAMRLLGELSNGEPPSAQELTDFFIVFNDMIDSWNAERLTIFTVLRQVFPVNANQQVYQIGPTAADWIITRPERIENAGIISLNNPDQPLELPMAVLTYEQWNLVPVKNISSALPLQLYYDMQYGLPGGYGLVYLWPVPQVTIQIALYLWQQAAQFASTGDLIAFPPGYREAFRYNLAVRLATEFGRQITPEVAALAVELKGNIKALNTPMQDMACDPGVVTTRTRQYNWLTGDFAR